MAFQRIPCLGFRVNDLHRETSLGVQRTFGGLERKDLLFGAPSFPKPFNWGRRIPCRRIRSINPDKR